MAIEQVWQFYTDSERHPTLIQYLPASKAFVKFYAGVATVTDAAQAEELLRLIDEGTVDKSIRCVRRPGEAPLSTPTRKPRRQADAAPG